MSAEFDFIPERGWLRDYVDFCTPLTEATPEAHFGAGLALLSAAVGWRGWVQWGLKPEPLTIWVILEGLSAASRKSTSSGTAMELARRVAISTTDVGGPDDDPAPRLRALSVSGMSDKGIISELAPRDEDQKKRWESTPPPGILVEWDEIASALAAPQNRANDWIGNLQKRLMSIYGGRTAAWVTGKEKILEGRCSMSILGTMTRRDLEDPHALDRLISSGFIGRFLLIPHQGRTKVLSRPPARGAAFDQAQKMLELFLVRLVTSTTEFGHAYDRLTPEAEAMWDEWYRRRSRQLEGIADETQDPADAALFSVHGRIQTTAMKTAAVLAISEWTPGTDLASVRIEARHVETAIKMAEFVLTEVQSLLGCEDQGPESAFQRQVINVVSQRNGHGPIAMRELLRSVKAHGLSYERRKRAVWALHPEELVCKDETYGRNNTRTMVGMPHSFPDNN